MFRTPARYSTTLAYFLSVANLGPKMTGNITFARPDNERYCISSHHELSLIFALHVRHGCISDGKYYSASKDMRKFLRGYMQSLIYKQDGLESPFMECIVDSKLEVKNVKGIFNPNRFTFSQLIPLIMLMREEMLPDHEPLVYHELEVEKRNV